MSTIKLEAEIREDMGKGASRRLRRLENKVPAVIYGGDKPAQSIHLVHHKLLKALETESIYSSVFDVKVAGKVEHVILKDLQRHPYKPIVLHMDLQRVSAKDTLVKMIPIHYINEATAKGVKAGGMISHTMSQLEVKCQVKDLPEFITVDVAAMEVNDVLHLSDLKLPKGVKLAVDPTEGDHDHPVVSIHMPKVVVEEEITPESEAEAEKTAEHVEATKEEGSDE
jgi:large subunit ribosomal protein L25